MNNIIQEAIRIHEQAITELMKKSFYIDLVTKLGDMIPVKIQFGTEEYDSDRVEHVRLLMASGEIISKGKQVDDILDVVFEIVQNYSTRLGFDLYEANSETEILEHCYFQIIIDVEKLKEARLLIQG